MENEIKVGEFIRTKLGDIKKITEGFEFIIKRYNESDNKIVKHSSNLIDIMEERRLCKWIYCKKNIKF